LTSIYESNRNHLYDLKEWIKFIGSLLLIKFGTTGYCCQSLEFGSRHEISKFDSNI